MVQLTKCYRPVVELVFNKPVVMLVAFKHWFSGSDLELIECPEDLLSLPIPLARQPFGWHVLH